MALRHPDESEGMLQLYQRVEKALFGNVALVVMHLLKPHSVEV